MRSAVSLALAVLVLACDDGRLSELEDEVRTLEENRVPIESVEKARAEAEQSEAERRKLEQVFAEAEGREDEVAARLESLKAALASEQAGAARDRAELDAQRARVHALRLELESQRGLLVQRRAAVDLRLDEVRRTCEHIVEVADQIRDSDPAWATARRITVLEELLRKVADQNPDDEVLRAIAQGSDEESSTSPGGRIHDVRTRAEQVRARLVAVYGTGGVTTAGACPIPGAKGLVDDQVE